jgi:DNA polymerase-3 subunit alpha
MVYQEQIMQTAQIIAGYSLGGADLLRRAMGKKDKEKMAKERVKFVAGAKELHNINEKDANAIFDDIEKFAEYGFNRSHSAAYSVVAYQTAYLKANYTAEYMAAVLTHNMTAIEKISFFMEECRNQGVQVLGPDINESALYFDVNKEGKIRFGMAAIKGTGEAAVEAITQERENGPFRDIFDFSTRVNLRSVNKKTFESLAQAGAFDTWSEYHRAQYLESIDGETNLIDKAVRYGTAVQSEKLNASASLFGGGGMGEISKPKVIDTPRWSALEQLRREKETIGFYISGHPLDEYRSEIKAYTNCELIQLKDITNRNVTVAGIVSKVIVRKDKSGNDFGNFTMEDYSGSFEFRLFSGNFLKYANLLQEGKVVRVSFTPQKRRFGNEEYELMVQDVMLLADVHERLTKSVTLKIPVEYVAENLTDQLEKLLSQHAGTCPVKVQILADAENVTTAPLQSNKYRLLPTPQLFQTLSEIKGVQVSFN